MQEKLKDLQSNSLLEVSSWWGLHNPGKSGIIITQDKKIYYYNFYHRMTSFLEKNNIPLESITKGKTITEKEYEKVIKFIEEEIVGKTFTQERIFDVGYTVRGNYKGQPYNIYNNIGYGKELGLYNKAKELIDTIKGE